MLGHLKQLQAAWLFLPALALAADPTARYSVISTAPTNAPELGYAPVGVSFEFWAFPAYFQDAAAAATKQCLANLHTLSGIWPLIRIGGYSQDRATYNPDATKAVEYSMSDPLSEPVELKFGPEFMKLAASYGGRVTFGLNRANGDLQDTLATLELVREKVPNIHSVELGNEPENYKSYNRPIASGAGVWDPATDAQSQNNWIEEAGKVLLLSDFFQAGNFIEAPPTWGASELIATQNDSVKSYVRSYAHHHYPVGSVRDLMSHRNITDSLEVFRPEISAATAAGKDFVLGEANTAGSGGDPTVSPVFGAALWTLDYALRALSIGVKRVHFHHSRLGDCPNCWWGAAAVGAPYYGAVAATAAVAGGAFILSADGGASMGIYIVYDSARKPMRAVLYNPEFFDGSKTRNKLIFQLAGLTTSSVTVRRLTATSATARSDQGPGGGVTFAGQGFSGGSCLPSGDEVREELAVTGGTATVVVSASEAVLVELQPSTAP
ncbi:unnamed protein product [Diplocarpon coronariae]